jgi:phosphomevalonate kinase
MRVFLIAGKAGCGKNEVANIIKRELPNTVITAFSKYIKLFTMEFTDWDGRDETKPREFLQNMGDKLRAIDNDFLTKRILEDIQVYSNEGISNVVISDVRLVNEIEFFKKIDVFDVITIRVNCDSSARCLSSSEKNHHTELALDDYNNFDYVIHNRMNEDLEKQVKEILEGMK